MIILQFNRRYYHWATLLLRSLELHEPDRRVLCDTVGLRPDQLCELGRSHPRVVCRNSQEDRDCTAADMANRKPFVLRWAFEQFPDEPWFCLLDADMLARRPLDDLWGHVRHAPAALMFTDGMWEGRFYLRLVTLSGIVLVRRDGLALVDRWADNFHHAKPIDRIRPREWFWDQVTLFLAWCDCGLRVAPIALNRFANDQLATDASIWSANVPDKDGHYRRFLAEHERQRG
jgi:hypothetical protein